MAGGPSGREELLKSKLGQEKGKVNVQGGGKGRTKGPAMQRDEIAISVGGVHGQDLKPEHHDIVIETCCLETWRLP